VIRIFSRRATRDHAIGLSPRSGIAQGASRGNGGRVKALKTLCASVVLVAACSAPWNHDTVTTDPTSAQAGGTFKTGIPLDCNVIGDELPTPDYLVVLDLLALPAPQSPALQTGRLQDATPPVSYFAKTGLGFKAGSSWRLSVAPEDQDHLRIGWGSPGIPSITVLPPAKCSPTSRTGWLWYPGGYWTDHPGCYTVVAQAAHQSQRVPIGVGAPCPGQKPPVGPSNP
jgi:hypothetical protein